MTSFNLDLNSTLGALEIGVDITAFLFGCITVQSYTYFRRFPNDPLLIKVLVAVTWFIQLGAQITTSQSLYILSVLDWGHVFSLLIQPKEIIASFFLCITIAPLVETFYLFRIYRFAGRGSRFIVGVGLLIVWVRYAGWLVLGVAVARSSLLDGAFVDQWSWLITTQLALGVLIDAMISSTIVYFLRKRKDDGVANSAKVIHHLVKWTIQTGFVASAAFLISLLCFLFVKETFIWLAIMMVLPKVFSNCLLASLNARQYLQQQITHPTSESVPLPCLSSDRSDPLRSEDSKNMPTSFSDLESQSPTPNRSVLIHISREILRDHTRPNSAAYVFNDRPERG